MLCKQRASVLLVILQRRGERRTDMHLFCFVCYKYQLSQLPISLSPSLGNSCRCQGQKVGLEERVKTLQISSMHKAQQRKAWIFVGGGDKPSMLALLVERKWASIVKNRICFLSTHLS
ncbi:homeobox protein Nkx-2.4 [Platysternon megacephalum]|uniref:Homeobox protein Nkx-2.4 n=1 Tax=Platysternon megacephalum TaxID=55544 RepID=A0A4D9EH59_9SAUR|nr:homeobox protein Nkx-2.4 [Platysternon megacephalum]